MSKIIVGLDVGTTALRAVEVADADRPKPTVTRFAQVPLPPGAVRNGEIEDAQVVSANLRRLWATGGFKSRDVVLGMGNQRVIARDLTVPRQSMQRIRESLPFQVQELIPVPAAEALLDFYPISEGQTEQGPVLTGLLLAAVKEPVLNNINSAQLGGLNPIDVDAIPFALSRVLASSPASGVQALIDVGANTTSVVVTVGRVPHFVRIIPTGGDDITRGLATRLDITEPEAETLKRQLAASEPLHAASRDALKAVYQEMSDLIVAVTNTLSYFTSNHTDIFIERIVLSGGGSLLTGFGRALGEIASLPVSWADPFQSISMTRAAKASAENGRFAMTVALGLALGGRA